MKKNVLSLVTVAIMASAAPSFAAVVIGNYGTGSDTSTNMASITIPNASGAVLNPHAAPFVLGATGVTGALGVKLKLNYHAGSIPSVAIYSDIFDNALGYNRPDTSLIAFTMDGGQTTTPGNTAQDIYFSGSGSLLASTSYWLVVGNASATPFDWRTYSQTNPITASDIGASNPGFQDYKYNNTLNRWAPYNAANTDERGIYEIVPEPQSWAMCGVVLVGVAGYVIRRRRAVAV